jgi:hypothetical protein
MKQLSFFFLAFFTLSKTFAQTPQLLNYQAVIRNTSNQLVVNSPLGMQVSVLQGSATGTAVYVERHFPRSGNTGIVTLNIGGGTVVSGVFANINWASGTYFLKTETDLNGGANYTINGISQMLSVPYALNAKVAETVDYNKLTNLPTMKIAGWGTIAANGTIKKSSGNFTLQKRTDQRGVYDIRAKDTSFPTGQSQNDPLMVITPIGTGSFQNVSFYYYATTNQITVIATAMASEGLQFPEAKYNDAAFSFVIYKTE